MKRRVLLIAAVLLSATIMTFASGNKIEASQELYTVTQGGFSTIVEPLSQAESAGLFYGYNTRYHASADTGFETSSKSFLFLYRDTSSGELSLFMVHDRYLDNGGGSSMLNFAGIPEGASWTVKDDPESLGDRYYPAAHNLGWAARWGWGYCCTDGGVIGDIDGFSEITITPRYWSGINTWVFVAGDANNPTFITLPNLTEPVTISIAAISAPLDIKPQSCPNPINTRSRGLLPVALLGAADFDATEVDVSSIQLAGVSPLRAELEDVATSYEPYTGKAGALDCTEEGPDGFLDLALKFDKQAVIRSMEGFLGGLADGEVLYLELSGSLSGEYGGLPVVGEDVVIIRSKGKK